VNDDSDDLQDQLFLLPNGEPASFLLHNFESVGLTKKIIVHGGQITDFDTAADVILTKSRSEYTSLKDRYAISRKAHVRLSGFVDRCIDSRRFQLEPIIVKGLQGRRPMSRRTEFSATDDEHLCQYIAEILPDKGQGGRTGHFIYSDLMRRADEFGQYAWARRHPKDGWRERYRRNQERLDKRITRIVEKNPPSLDGKGQYMSRRYGRIVQDHELDADDEELVGLDPEERGDSATDNEDSPVQTKKADVQRQEEEEEEDEGQVVMQRPGATNPRSQDSERQEEERAEEQAAEWPETGSPTRMATRRSRISRGETPGPKRRRTRAPRAALEELSVPDDLEATLRGDAEVDDFNLVEEPQPNTPPFVETRKGNKSRSKVTARPVVPPLSPRRTRARSRSLSVQPDAVPAASRTTSRAKAKATAAAAALKPVPASPVIDDFVLHSDGDDEFVAHSDDEGEMHEVEADLQVSVRSGELPAEDQMQSIPSAEDLLTSGYLQRPEPNDAAPVLDDLDDDESDDAKFLALGRKFGALTPTAGQNKSGKGDRDRHKSSEETFPSPGTRAEAEKKRLTQAAKAAPYFPPKGTRAATMIEKEGARARQAAVRAVRR
jgi:hypothetical protein